MTVMFTMAYYLCSKYTVLLLYEKAFREARRKGVNPSTVLRRFPPRTENEKRALQMIVRDGVPPPSGGVGRLWRWFTEPVPGATLEEYYDITPLGRMVYAFEMQSGVGASSVVHSRAEQLLSLAQLMGVVAVHGYAFSAASRPDAT